MLTTNFNQTNYNKKMMTLPLEILDVEKYQRPLSTSKVDTIVKEFDPVGIGTVLISKRNDKYYIFDGQHRVSALKRLGIDTVDCIVYEGMSYQDEANAFKYFNGDNKKATALETANARYEAGDELVHAIDRAVKATGLKVDFKSTNNYGTIQAYKALEATFKKYGPQKLQRTLNYIQKVFRNNFPNLYSADNIRGFTLFFESYGNHENFKERVLTKWLKQIGIEGFKTEVKKMKQVWQLTGQEAVSATLLKIHNDHRNYENHIK